MTNFRLAAHPTPNAQFDFQFTTKREFDAYIEFEHKVTNTKITNLYQAITKEERTRAKAALAATRIVAYKKWQELKHHFEDESA